MPALQVRDLPVDLYDQLKIRAEEEHRSLAQEAVVAIESYLQQPTPSNTKPFTIIEGEGLTRAQKRQRVFNKIDGFEKIEMPKDFPDIVELIHQGREGHDHSIVSTIGDERLES